MSKRAVILAGGKGTRLRPYTVVFPKPLMPVGDYPILEVIVRQLAFFGFDHITMAVNQQANLIKAFFGDGAPWKVRIDYSLESQPLSTIAPLKLIPDLPENFLLLNGDILTDLDMGALLQAHVAAGRLFTIAAAERTHTIDYGVLHVASSDTLTGFSEKPQVKYLVSMGIYAVDRDVLSDVPVGKKYGFDDLMRDMLAQSKAVHVQRHSGYWLDIGRPDDYRQAIEEFEQHKDRLLQHG
jgi:NDP-sugar pyrophosphorylase family protein